MVLSHQRFHFKTEVSWRRHPMHAMILTTIQIKKLQSQEKKTRQIVIL